MNEEELALLEALDEPEDRREAVTLVITLDPETKDVLSPETKDILSVEDLA
jgi:hypothetical protein